MKAERDSTEYDIMLLVSLLSLHTRKISDKNRGKKMRKRSERDTRKSIKEKSRVMMRFVIRNLNMFAVLGTQKDHKKRRVYRQTDNKKSKDKTETLEINNKIKDSVARSVFF